LAQEYRKLTGKPLGITGEVAEYEAARLLGLKLTAARTAGYDAIRPRGRNRRVSIKGRCLHPGASNSQRLGRIDVDKDFDSVLLVMMDENFEATAIYEAPRAPVVAALTREGSKSRNERGQLAVAQFIRIANKVWPPKS
jgi:hypothetical protein